MSQSPTEKDIFRVASNIESEEVRAEYLNQACGENAALRARLDLLLRVSRDETDFLATEPISFDPTETREWPPSEQPGEMIGPYRLLERIGEGGFGVVYAAEQTHPISRRVALKIIKPGMDSQEVISRFNAERQTLALMDHTHIARVLDAGRAQNGRPYFVMELVEGVPITEFCDEQRLTTLQRLQLFVDVCRAVQHAHQKGIIHRDLKPSNILVCRQDGAAVAKVIDFGVAKALSGQLMPDSLSTVQGQMIGTPLYMSPEQAQMGGIDVDTRSDIYSLGVVLYELLTGTPPLDRQKLEVSGLQQLQRLLREMDPLKPSSRLSTLNSEQSAKICDRRQIEQRQLLHLVRGELDWIVMKALEKDRDRRYESAAALADDIERFLAGDAVLAGPPSPTYRLRKLAYHYRGVLVSIALVFLALSVGLAVALLQREQALAARQQVQQTLDEVRRQKQRAEVLAYVADISLAARALDRADVVDAFELLNRHQPSQQQTDYRGIEWSLLMNRTRGSSRTTPISDKALYTVSLSPGGAHLVTAGADGTIYVLDARSLRLEDTIDSQQIEVNGLSFSADGRTLVSTGDDGTIRLWKFPSGQPQNTIPFEADRSYIALITPDGKSLIACGQANDVRIFSLRGGNQIASLEGHERTVNDIALSPDGRLLACASSDFRASVWDWRQRKRLFFSGERRGRVTSIVFSPDGQRVIDGCLTGRVSVTDVQTERRIARFDVGDDVQGLAMSLDGRSVAALTRTGTLHTLPLDAPGESAAPASPAINHIVHTGRVYDGLWSDPQTLISVGVDGHLGRTTLGDAPTPGREIPGVVARDVAVSPDGTLLAWNTQTALGLYDRVNEKHVPLAGCPTDTNWRSARFSPDGRMLIAGTDDGRLVAVPVERPHEATIHHLPDDADITSIRFSEDGRRLAVVDWQNDRVFVFAVPTFQEILRLPSEMDAVEIADLSHDGSLMVINRARDLLVYDVDTHRRLAISDRHHTEHLADLSFLPSGQTIVSIGEDRQIRLWNWQSSARSELVGVHPTGKKLQLALSRDGRTLLSRSTQGEILFWSLPARQRLFSLSVGAGHYQAMGLAANDSGVALVDQNDRVHWIPLGDAAASAAPATTLAAEP